MNTPLTLLIDEEVQQYLDYYIECFDIRIALFDARGQSIMVGKQKNNCEYCQLFREFKQADDLCLKLDAAKRAEAADSDKTLLYQCHAGLWEAVRAVKIEGVLIGFAMVGQIRLDKDMKLQDQNHPLKEELKKLYDKAALRDRSKMPAMLGLFDALVEFMVLKNLMKIRTDVFTEKILSFIEDRLDQRVALKDGAAFMNMTPQALAHSIRRHGLEPFTVLVQKRKIREAQSRLNGDPQLSIKVLAHDLGFKDQYYFSRVFKKYARVSPSHYKSE